MKRAFLMVSCLMFVCACEREVKVPPPQKSAEADASSSLPINIGDVEALVYLYCDVPENLGDAENIDVERKNTRRYDLGMLTIDLYPPYPTSIPVRLWLEDKLRKQSVVVVLRGNILRDNEPIQPVQFLLSKNSGHEADITQADPLANLDTVPETMLVHAAVDAVLLPETTDLSTVDIATVQGTSETQSVLLSNPIRINFHPPKEGS